MFRFLFFFFINIFFLMKKLTYLKISIIKNFLYNLKIDILCFYLCYDVYNSKNFNQAAFSLKTIFNIIHSNYLILISFVISTNNIDNIDNNYLQIINVLKFYNR